MSMSPSEQGLLADLRARVAYLERNAEAPGIPDWSTLAGVPSALRTDPNVDRIIFWDDSAGALQHLGLGNWLSITGTTLAVVPSAASASAQGVVELATDAEAQTGTDTGRAVTPANLSARTATTTRSGLAELATAAETQTGTDTARVITPDGLRQHKGVPFALSLQKISVASIASTASADITVTFPSGRFSVAPGVILTSFGTRLNWQVTDGSISSTGCTIRVSNWTSGAQAATFVEVLAIQMTSTTGEG